MLGGIGMKNREKFREKIINLANSEEGGAPAFCDFVRSNVLPNFTNKECDDIWCYTCTRMFAFWLDEEYVEPPKHAVDWSKVPVDTLVRVHYDKSNKWILRYFKGYEHGAAAPYVTWASGTTSATSSGLEEHWNYCELVEVEDE